MIILISRLLKTQPCSMYTYCTICLQELTNDKVFRVQGLKTFTLNPLKNIIPKRLKYVFFVAIATASCTVRPSGCHKCPSNPLGYCVVTMHFITQTVISVGMDILDSLQ